MDLTEDTAATTDVNAIRYDSALNTNYGFLDPSSHLSFNAKYS
jgi:hypothetical protein